MASLEARRKVHPPASMTNVNVSTWHPVACGTGASTSRMRVLTKISHLRLRAQQFQALFVAPDVVAHHILDAATLRASACTLHVPPQT